MYQNNNKCKIQEPCPNIVIRRHDNKPPFKVTITGCSGPLEELTDPLLIAEVNIWFNVKIKKDLTESQDYFALADNIGFNQIMINDIIVVDQVRRPERLKVVGFDEYNKYIKVERAIQNTELQKIKKGTTLKVFRTIDAPAAIEIITGDLFKEDGTKTTNNLLYTNLVYNWQAKDTCTPGIFYLEFKIIKMIAPELISDVIETQSCNIIPSFTPSTLTLSDYYCSLGADIEWIRRFPTSSEGYIIKVFDSPTAEFS